MYLIQIMGKSQSKNTNDKTKSTANKIATALATVWPPKDYAIAKGNVIWAMEHNKGGYILPVGGVGLSVTLEGGCRPASSDSGRVHRPPHLDNVYGRDAV